MASSGVVYGLYSICVSDASKGQVAVDGACVVQESLSQRGCDWMVMKGSVLSRKQCLVFFWERIAYRWESDPVVVAAFVERHQSVSWSLLVGRCPFFEPVCGTASFTVLVGLIDRS
jgi:hypothetical protein